MSEQHVPQPGELWQTEIYYGVEMRDGRWVLPASGDPVQFQNQTPNMLVGYTVAYVDDLRAGQADAVAELTNLHGRAVIERDELQRRNNNLVEALERAEEQIAEKLGDNPVSADADARDPWVVLREAALIYRDVTPGLPGQVNVTVDRLLDVASHLEADASEAERVAALIEKAAKAIRESVLGAGDGFARHSWDELADVIREQYRDSARAALLAAGLLADGDQA